MRLAFCSSSGQWAGVKTWTVESAAALAARGHEVFVYGRDNSAYARRARSFRLSFRESGRARPFHVADIRHFKQDFAELRIEALFVHDPGDLRSAGIAARMLGLPVIRYLSSAEAVRDDFSTRMLHRYIRPRYIVPSGHVRDLLLEALPFVKEEAFSILPAAKAPLREPSHALSRPLRVVSTSMVRARSGHVELAHTLARLLREGHPFEWHIAGTGESMDELRMECSRLGIANRVRFYGFMQDVRRLLLECDVFVLSSYAVGQGSSLLEAMACSLVPVARNLEGMGEFWPEKLPFLLAPPSGYAPAPAWYGRDTAGLPLYAPLKRVFTAQPKELVAMKYHAWRHQAANFSLGARIAELESLLHGLTADPAAKGRELHGTAPA